MNRDQIKIIYEKLGTIYMLKLASNSARNYFGVPNSTAKGCFCHINVNKGILIRKN